MATDARAGTDRNAHDGSDARQTEQSRRPGPHDARRSLRRGGRQSGPAYAGLGAPCARATLGSPRTAVARTVTTADTGRQTRVVLRDGSRAAIRPVQSGDAALLAEGFAGLSAQSRHQRFLTGKAELSAAELRYFTHVDHRNHEALGALSQPGGRGLGIARYIRDPDRPEAAEVAVAIIDEWQGRGLGTELLSRLAEQAYQEDIRYFTALVASENVAVVAVMRHIGTSVRLTGPESGAVEYQINLTPAGSQ